MVYMCRISRFKSRLLKSKLALIFIGCILAFVILLIGFNRDYISEYIERYTQSEVYQFGKEPINPSYEAQIREIAREVGIKDPFIIYKMNQPTLVRMGYYNAFVYFPMLLNFIPLTNIPYLFISDQFFEDLSPQEQRFLIGHELIHVKEHHLQYLNVISMPLCLLLLVAAYFLRRWALSKTLAYCTKKYFKLTSFALSCCLFLIALVIPEIADFGYRRHIEWYADHESLSILKSHDGCLKLMERLNNEFEIPLHNKYGGIMSTHPSCHERKQYCILLQDTSKDIV